MDVVLELVSEMCDSLRRLCCFFGDAQLTWLEEDQGRVEAEFAVGQLELCDALGKLEHFADELLLRGVGCCLCFNVVRKLKVDR